MSGRRKRRGDSGDGSPRRLDEALGSFLRRSGLDEKVEQAGAVTDWAERVGDNIARVTRPIRVTDGTLLVAVRSSAWLMELRMMERQILQRLNAGVERGTIHGIRFVMDAQDG